MLHLSLTSVFDEHRSPEKFGIQQLSIELSPWIPLESSSA